LAKAGGGLLIELPMKTAEIATTRLRLEDCGSAFRLDVGRMAFDKRGERKADADEDNAVTTTISKMQRLFMASL
jgi:hypothetical protein